MDYVCAQWVWDMVVTMTRPRGKNVVICVEWKTTGPPTAKSIIGMCIHFCYLLFINVQILHDHI